LFQPLESGYQQARALARDTRRHHLTGTVSADRLSAQQLFDLSAVLSFVEHLDVVVSEAIDDPEAQSQPERHFDLALEPRSRLQGGGNVIASDAFRPDSRRDFISLAMALLSDGKERQRTGAALLLFKSAETVRQRQPFIEITYFFLISALEAFCLTHMNDFATKNASEGMVRSLRTFGFDVEQDVLSRPERSIANFLHLRNALFHDGRFTKTIRLDGSERILNCSDYLFRLSMLVSLTVMKAVGFDDGHTNWDCWIDRQLLK